MKTFVWVDGPRPRRGAVTSYVNRLLDIGADEYILQLQGPVNQMRWAPSILSEVTTRLQNVGRDVLWMLWGYADTARIKYQMSYIHKVIDEYGVAPDGAQWDFEEQWDTKRKTIAEVKDIGDYLVEQIILLKEELPYASMSATAITKFPRPTFSARVLSILSRGVWDSGYAQAYSFYNPKKRRSGKAHWSTKLPTESKLISPIVRAWDSLGLSVNIGLAAYMQRWPTDYPYWVSSVPSTPMDAVQRSFNAAKLQSPAGIGWWSSKHVLASKKKEIIRLIANR